MTDLSKSGGCVQPACLKPVVGRPFDELYEPYLSEKRAFGSNWCGPAYYEHGKEILVARYSSAEDDDGQPVEVWCDAMPARFYVIRALEGRNSVGEIKKPFEMGTGSSMAQLAADMALAISTGMLALHGPPNDQDHARHS